MESAEQRANRKGLRHLLRGAASPSIVVDLSIVTSIDSAQLGDLVRFSRHCEKAGKICTFVLEKESRTARIISIAGLERVLNLQFHDEGDEAIPRFTMVGPI